MMAVQHKGRSRIKAPGKLSRGFVVEYQLVFLFVHFRVLSSHCQQQHGHHQAVAQAVQDHRGND